MNKPAGMQRPQIKILKAHRMPSFSATAGDVARSLFIAVLLLAAVFFTSACHSYHVEATVENRTGAPIQLLEVDYPSASFGADKLAAGDVFHYRIQLRGSGPLKVQYTGGDGRPVQVDGPTIVERQEGQLEIVLLPGGKVEFHPELSPAR